MNRIGRRSGGLFYALWLLVALTTVPGCGTSVGPTSNPFGLCAPHKACVVWELQLQNIEEQVVVPGGVLATAKITCGGRSETVNKTISGNNIPTSWTQVFDECGQGKVTASFSAVAIDGAIYEGMAQSPPLAGAQQAEVQVVLHRK